MCLKRFEDISTKLITACEPYLDPGSNKPYYKLKHLCDKWKFEIGWIFHVIEILLLISSDVIIVMFFKVLIF